MTGFAVDDRIRAVDELGELPPISGSVIQVSRFYAFIWWDKEDRERMGLPAKAEAFYLESGLQAFISEDRWRLQLVRTCWRCGHDITDQGLAHPTLWKTVERDGGAHWSCADRPGCLVRMDENDAQAGMEPLLAIWRPPVAMLEAAS